MVAALARGKFEDRSGRCEIWLGEEDSSEGDAVFRIRLATRSASSPAGPHQVILPGVLGDPLHPRTRLPFVVEFELMPWNKGFTKKTHPSVMKISLTMQRKKIDNFRRWRNRMKEVGRIPRNYPRFRQSADLAEYIGVLLGDGNISKFPRTERILISGNLRHPGFIEHYAKLTETLFRKTPTIMKARGGRHVRISLYQKEISRRLGIPTGSRRHLDLRIPDWIWRNSRYLIRLVKGLLEAEGSLSIHRPSYTYNFQFANRNQSLLAIMARALMVLGFHPERRYNAVRLRKRAEVEKLRLLVQFREY